MVSVQHFIGRRRFHLTKRVNIQTVRYLLSTLNFSLNILIEFLLTILIAQHFVEVILLFS